MVWIYMHSHAKRGNEKDNEVKQNELFYQYLDFYNNWKNEEIAK